MKSQTPAKGWKKGFGSAKERNSTSALALIPVPLGPGAMGAPELEEPPRRLEASRNSTTRLRDTVKMMKRGRV